LLVEAKTLQWSPTAPLILDVFEFENAVKAAEQATDAATIRSHLEQAVQWYRGDLLPECVDEWIAPERERLQQMRVRVLERLVDLLRDQQDYRTAIDYAQQLLRLDPINEATYASLMRLHGLSGDRANALQIYHRCMTMLREELGVDPSAATRDLYQRLLNEDERLPSKDSSIFTRESYSSLCPQQAQIQPSLKVPGQMHLCNCRRRF
jgi:DNA-binding SARP family transcriptional activator